MFQEFSYSHIAGRYIFVVNVVFVIVFKTCINVFFP